MLQDRLPMKFQDVKFKDPKFKHEIFVRIDNEAFILLKLFHNFLLLITIHAIKIGFQKYYILHGKCFP